MPENKNPNKVQKKKTELKLLLYNNLVIDSHLCEFRLSHKRSLLVYYNFLFLLYIPHVLYCPNEFVSLLLIRNILSLEFHTFGNPSKIKDRMATANKKATQIFASASHKTKLHIRWIWWYLDIYKGHRTTMFISFFFCGCFHCVSVCVRAFVYVFLNCLNSVSNEKKSSNQTQPKCVLIYFMLGRVDPFRAIEPKFRKL